MEDLMKNIKRVLVSKEELDAKCRELGAQLSKDYEGKRPLFIGVLKGCFMFFSDVVRNVTIDCQIDFMAISSYGASKSTSGEVKLIKDLGVPIENRHVVIIEDIVDSGVSLYYLANLLKSRGATSVEICTLLDKPERRMREIYPKYKGFVIPNEFVVGYGLDFDEKYRNLPEVCILEA